MYRAVTRGQDLIAWWPFDNEVVGATSVTGKTANAELANLYDGATVSGLGKFGKGLKFDRTNTRSRMTIQNNGIDLGNNWTLTVWAKNLLPPAANLRSTLYRGQGLQSGRDYDRYLVIRGSDRTICFFDGDDGNGNNRYRSTGYEVDPLMLSGWHHFSVLASGSRTNFYIDGKFVGDADREEQSDVMYVGNSSDNELFAEFLDDVRIYGVSLSFSEVASIYGEGFGDQFPSFLIDYNSSRDSDPRSAQLLAGKDGNLVQVTGLASSDWNLQGGSVALSPISDGNYSLSLDLNDSFTGSILSIEENASIDNDGKPSEAFREEVYLHELVYDEDHLVSRWAFDELNGTRFRDLGFGRNDGYVEGGANVSSGKFGNAVAMDGSGDYVRVPRFAGIHQDGNFTISAWVYPTNLGYNSDVQDAAIFGTDGNTANGLGLVQCQWCINC